jgi:hypothetical protein
MPWLPVAATWRASTSGIGISLAAVSGTRLKTKRTCGDGRGDGESSHGQESGDDGELHICGIGICTKD